MNDTPRVDEAILKSNGQWSYALVHVARQLERELAEAIKERDDAIEYLGICMQKLEFGSTEGDQ